MNDGRKQYLVFLIAMACLVSAGNAHAEKYYIYGEPRNGTKFKVKVYESDLPLGKSYVKLTAEQKQLFRNNYDGLADTSIPPFPKKGVGKLLKPYVKKFRWYGGQTSGGFVKIWIDAQGNAKSYNAMSGLSPSAAEFLASQARAIEFTPALCDGEACGMDFILEIKPIQDPELEHGSRSS